jgi:hypothetical protein
MHIRPYNTDRLTYGHLDFNISCCFSLCTHASSGLYMSYHCHLVDPGLVDISFVCLTKHLSVKRRSANWQSVK